MGLFRLLFWIALIAAAFWLWRRLTERRRLPRNSRAACRWSAALNAACTCRRTRPCRPMTAGTAARLTSSRTAPLVGTENLTFFGDQGRRILRLYHLYRLTIGLALVLLISSDLHNDLLQMSNPQLFQYGAWLYLILNIIVAVLVQSPERDLPVLSLALMDVILLSGLFYFGGGTPSGIGNLLIVAVAIANILLRGGSVSSSPRSLPPA